VQLSFLPSENLSASPSFLPGVPTFGQSFPFFVGWRCNYIIQSSIQSHYWQQNVTYLGTAWLIRRVFGFDDQIYWTFIKLVQFTNHSDILSSYSDWTLHRNYTDFQLNYLVLRCTPSVLLTNLLITPRHGPHGKHHILLSRMRVYWPVT
jgi:hypothetical protein